MHYAMLIYESESAYEQRRHADRDEFWEPWRRYHQSLVAAGVRVSGAPLEPPGTTATTIRVRGGERHVQDGPYADTKEQLGGFIIFDLPSLDAALEWAAKCPAASYGVVEVRPVADLEYIFGAGSQQLAPRD